MVYVMVILTALLALVLQTEGESWPALLLTALATLFAIPAINSFVTGLLRRFTDATGLNPRILVYIVTGAAALIYMIKIPPDLPMFDSANPYEFVTAWILIVISWAELAKKYYDLVLLKIPLINPRANGGGTHWRTARTMRYP